MATKIKVKIAGRMYPLTIKANEETYIRQASARIENMLKDFEKNYSVQDKQDVLAMCALQLASLLEKQKASNAENLEHISAHIEKFEKLAERALHDDTKDVL